MAKKISLHDIMRDMGRFRRQSGLGGKGLFYVDIETAYNSASSEFSHLGRSGVYDVSGIYLDPNTNTFQEIKYFIKLTPEEYYTLPDTESELRAGLFLSKERYKVEMTSARNNGYIITDNPKEVVQKLNNLPGFKSSIIMVKTLATLI